MVNSSAGSSFQIYDRNGTVVQASTALDSLGTGVCSTGRNFGTHETLLVNFTVDVDATDHAGVRWVELRDNGGGWTNFQEGTVAPDADHRWMAAIAMNGNGDIALMYNVTGTGTSPSVRYTGRLSSDPLGTMPQGDNALPGGTGTQFIDFRPCTDANGNPTNANCQRWGDYSASTGATVVRRKH